MKRQLAPMVAVLLAVLLVAAVAGCGSQNPATDKTTLRMIHINEPTTLDPAVCYDYGSQVMMCSYESLVRLKQGTTELEPCLAISWECSPDGLNWTFHLRDGVKFQDGTPMDAAAVKFSYERMLKINQGAAWMFECVDNISTPDAMTVVFALKKPYAPFLYSVAQPCATGIVSPAAVKAHEVNGDMAQGWLRTHTAGTGPYLVSQWVPGQQVELTRHKDYWRGWNGNHFQKIVFLIVKEASTQNMMIEKGQADLNADIADLTNVAEVAKTPGVRLDISDSLVMHYITLNTQHKPLDDVRVRQALAYAVDYEKVLSEFYNGYGQLAQGPVPKGLWGHDDSLPMYKLDLDKARALLAEAGQSKGFKLRLVYESGNDTMSRIAQHLQANLKQLNIDLQIEGLTRATIMDQFKSPDTAPDMRIDHWTVDYADPDDYLTALYTTAAFSPHGGNRSFYSNPQIDQMAEQANRMSDQSQREQVFKQMQQIIVRDCPSIWLVQPKKLTLLRDNVKNYTYFPSIWDYWYEMYKE